MNDIESLWDGKYGYFAGSYQHLVESFATVVIDVANGNYQGDCLYLLRNGTQWGFLSVGYGSCSYCDALEGCASLSDVLSLRDSIEQDAKWFETLEETKQYIYDEGRKYSWYAHEDGWNEFVEKVKGYEDHQVS